MQYEGIPVNFLLAITLRMVYPCRSIRSKEASNVVQHDFLYTGALKNFIRKGSQRYRIGVNKLSKLFVQIQLFEGRGLIRGEGFI